MLTTAVRKIPHYLYEKHRPFFRGRDLLDYTDFEDFLHPFPKGLPPPISDSPLVYHPPTHHIPGYPADLRMLLTRLYLQRGTFLDYYTGQHSPSLSLQLCGLYDETIGKQPDMMSVEETQRAVEGTVRSCLHDRGCLPLFPQFNVSQSWPKTVLLHGTVDTAVPVGESRRLAKLLGDMSLEVELIEIEGEEHSFDLARDAEDRFRNVFDKIVDILLQERRIRD